MIKPEILIIGAGNMGSAFYRGLSAVFPKESLFVCDTDPDKLAALKSENVSSDPNEFLARAKVVILATKPQSFEGLAESVKGRFSGKLVLSVMAGVSIEKMKRLLGAEKVIRSMPNLPAQVGKGLVGWIASPEVSKEERELAYAVFSSLGSALEVREESQLDSITALSGCGPAYFFHLTELMQEVALGWGFSEAEARTIAKSTFEGAAELMHCGQRSAAEWVGAVASKGGATEAALKTMVSNGFATNFKEALESARKRTVELNK
jgi:pyrroline-5-carboxylate reductase